MWKRGKRDNKECKMGNIGRRRRGRWEDKKEGKKEVEGEEKEKE